MTAVPLQSSLQRVGRRLVAVLVAAGVGWGLAAAVLLALAGAWLDLMWELPPGLRIATLAVAVAAAIGLLIAACGLAARRRTPQSLAQRLDAAANTGGEIRSGVDLLSVDSTAPPLTVGLATIAVDRAGRLAGQVPGTKAVPTTPARRAFGLLTVLVAGVALLALTLPRLAETQWLRFSDPFGDHPPYSRVQFTIEPGDVRALYGSGVDIRVTTDMPVDRLHLVLQNAGEAGEEALPMFPEPRGGWRATLAGVTTPGRYFVRAHAGRSQRYRIDVITVPQIESVRFRVTPPAYTNRPATEGPLPPGGLAGLIGTKVEVFAKSNRPLAGGKLELAGPAGPATVDLAPLSANSPEATGSFTILAAGSLKLKVTDTEGQPSLASFSAAVTLLADERPFVRLLEPPAQSFATPEAVLPVTIAAEDDYGISRIQLFRSLNDSRALPLDLPLKVPPPTRWSERMMLPLAAYGLQPGDEIKLFARVEDNDPAGAKGSESTIAVVRIIAQSELDRLQRVRQGLEMLQSKYQQAQRRLEGLADEADRLRKKLKDQPPPRDETERTARDKEARDALTEMIRQMQREADLLKKAAQKDLGYDIDHHLTRHLEQTARDVERLARELEKKAKEEKLTPEQIVKELEKLEQQLAREKQQIEEQTVKPLERLAQVQKLLEDQQRYVILTQRQRGLADRLKSLDGKERPDDPAIKSRMRDLQSEQQQLRIELERLLEDIEDHVARLPEAAELEDLRTTAQDFVEALRGSGADEAMGEAESGLGEFSGTRGHAGAKKAADILEQFLSKCNGMGKQGRACLKFQPGLADGLGDTCEQLLREAGLMGDGEGTGQGQGQGGYSARRNSLQNVGLYGGLPNALDGGDGLVAEWRGSPNSSRSQGTTQPGSPASARPNATMTGTGSIEALIPTSYRRRVAEYFQRIADETGGIGNRDGPNR